MLFLKEPEVWRHTVREEDGSGKRGSYAVLLANPRWYLPAAVAGVAALGLMRLYRGPRLMPVPLLFIDDLLRSPLRYFLGLMLLAAGVWTLVGNRAGIRASAVLIGAALLEVAVLASPGEPKRELLVGLVCLLVVVGLLAVLRPAPSGDGIPRWRRNGLVGLGLGWATVGGLHATGFFTPQLISTALTGEPRAMVASVLVRCAVLQELGGFLGMLTFAAVATFVGRRWTFAGALLVCWLTTLCVFNGLRTATDAYWMLPLLGFAQLSLFAGNTIYFPELFPTRLRGTGVGFCCVMSRLPAAVVPFLYVSLINHLPVPVGTDWLRTSASILSCFYLLGLIALIWAPETKKRSLTED
jgi:hypothetical protein